MVGDGDLDVERYLALVRESGRPCFEDLSVADARAFYRAARDTVNLPSVAVGAVIDDIVSGQAGAIPVRRYLPVDGASDPRPAILFFHGGGWVIGDLETHDSICRHLARATGLQLIAVNYRLAPEHRFPAAVDDALDAHAAILARAGEWGIDLGRIVLAGDSAGGCLSLVVALDARDKGRRMPAAQLLFYPVTDLRGGTPSYGDVDGVPITARTMDWFRDHYLNASAEAGDWRTSPLLAPLHGLPPSFVTVAGRDPLRDEGLALARALETGGTPVELRWLPDQVHGYLTLGRIMAEAERSIAAAARFVTAALDMSGHDAFI